MELMFAEQNTHFNAILRGPSLRKMSSQGLNWKDLVIEKYSAESGERPETVSDHYILGVWCGHPAIGEHANGRGGYSPYTKRPGAITVIPPGIIPAVRRRNRIEIMLCTLEPRFLSGVEDELDRRPAKLEYQTGFHDTTLRQLMTLLAAEAGQGGPSGRLYVDHLAHALAVRLLLSGVPEKHKASAAVSALPTNVLRRVIERMHDFSADLNLEALAAESGYSRGHFLRMFQATTGLTPHRYLQQLRLERAQELIKERSASLIDIAAICGFSSQSHLSTVFRQLRGMTPTEYRRSL
jgi:AraC family transcriptional regulator